MNKIEKMIKELCPNGVEWKKLGEICVKVSSGGTPNSKNSAFYNGDIPWLRTQEINFKNIYETEMKITQEGMNNSSAKWIPANCVIVAMYGATVGKIGINKIPLTTNQACCNLEINSDMALYKYVFYCLCSQYEYIKSLGEGSQTNINAQIVKNLQIPLPPLPIQTEIVRILDKFVEQQEQLERLIELRKKQYEYYREEMLKPKEGEKWETKTLGEIGTFVRGNGLQKTDFREEGVGCIHYGQIYTYYGMFTNKTKSFVSPELASKLKKVEQGDIVLACTSENIEDVCMCVVWEGKETIVTGGHSSIYKHNENPRFIAYFLKSKAFEVQKIKYAYGAKVIDIKNDDLEKIYIFLPSREKQDEIVESLNKFESSIESLKFSLESSRRRYEYYRNEMMRF